jgi:simple sugar transport system permease protein
VFFQTEAADGSLIRITLPIVVAAAAALATWLLMSWTAAGRQLYCMGGNTEAARRLGISIGRMHYVAYGFLGFMAGVAGLVQAHRVGQSVPNAMVGQELNVLAAAVLGGASLNGGVGSVGGVLLGLLMLAILQNGLNLLGWSSYFFPIVIGLVILISTSITGLANRPRRRAARAAGAAHG